VFDAFFKKVFGDSEPCHLGSGWASGVASVIFGMLGLGGALCLHFPEVLTLPEARYLYPMVIIRFLIQGTIVLAVVLAIASAVLRQRKVLAVTGLTLGLLAAGIGGGSTPLPSEISSTFGLGFDWFLLDLFVKTIVFAPLESNWPVRREQSPFRPQWTTDAFYFLATHLPTQLLTFLMLIPAALVSEALTLTWLVETVGSWPLLVQLPLAILVVDLSQYATHRMFHRIPVLWRFHSIHHSIESLDWLAGSRLHFVDILLTRGLALVPLTLLGFSSNAMAGYLLVVTFHATLCHANFRPRSRWLEPWFVTARYHHWHHAAHPEALNVNFAIHFPFIDRLFGTQYLPKDAWPERYGLMYCELPSGFFAQLIAPFKKAVRA
jgi:lathosterol oxidase